MKKPPSIDPRVNVSYLDKRWLDANGILKLLPADEFRSVPWAHLALWCYQRGRYLIPTIELVDYVKGLIGHRTAVELAAGNADFGYHLGIPATDSYQQQEYPAAVRLLYQALGQQPTKPPSYVEKLEAIAAMNKYMPKVAIASWMTRKFIEGVDNDGAAQANIWGVEEERILDTVEMYIHVGNRRQHDEKTILRAPHRAIHIKGMVSRSFYQEDDIIYIWGE